MTDQQSAQPPSTTHQPAYSGVAVGLTFFASIMMMLIGAFQATAGFVELLNGNYFVTSQRWLLTFDSTRWGWIHLAIGIVLIIAGMALIAGAVWARVVAVILAGISAVANFVWLPVYPVWGIIVIALDVLVIWAVTFHGKDITRV